MNALNAHADDDDKKSKAKDKEHHRGLLKVIVGLAKDVVEKPKTSAIVAIIVNNFFIIPPISIENQLTIN